MVDRLSAGISLIVSLPDKTHKGFKICITIWRQFTHPRFSHIRSRYAVACHIRHLLWANNPGFFQASEGRAFPEGKISPP